MRERIAEYGDYEVTRHPTTGMFEVWSPSLRLAMFNSEYRARQWAEALHNARKQEEPTP